MSRAIVTVPRRSAAAHRAILGAAANVAAERGYFAATIEDIARQAGVGKQTIYRWWQSKPALYLEVYQTLVPADGLRPDTGSLRADLLALLATLFAQYRETPAGAILAGLIAEAQANQDLAEAMKAALIDSRRSLLIEPLRRGADRGELASPEDVPLIADLFVGAIWYRLLVDPQRTEQRFDNAFASALIDKLIGA